MNKKLIGLVCIGLLGTSMSATVASAEVTEIKDNNGNVVAINIDNSDGETKNTAEIKVEGQVGFDNTNPDSPDPLNPNLWLNVNVPTEMAFNSTDQSDHKDITGIAGKIENKSARPVKVDAISFNDGTAAKGNAVLTGVSALDLVPSTAGTKIDLKAWSKIAPATAFNLVTLDSPNVNGQNKPISGVSDVTLNITGSVEASLEKHVESHNVLEFQFTALDKDGNVLPDNSTTNP